MPKSMGFIASSRGTRVISPPLSRENRAIFIASVQFYDFKTNLTANSPNQTGVIA
jgi:hypothetical protein